MFFSRFRLKSKNINLIGSIELIIGLIFFVPILALYLEKELFSVRNVALIFAIQAITMSILEIPTGAIADLFGRKKAYVSAILIYLSSLVFLYIGGSMIMFILFAVFSATGMALKSGTDNSIIYDTLKEENKEKDYKRVMSILYALWPLGAILGSVAGGYFAKFSLQLPILLSFIPFIIAFILSLFIKEPRYTKEEHKNIFKQMWNSSKTVFHSKQLLLLMTAGFIMLAFGETAHNLKPIFFEFKNIPIEYFGIVFGFTFAFSSLGHYLSYYVSEKIGNKLTLILSAIAFPLFLFLSTLTTGAFSMALLVITSVSYGLRNPVLQHLLNSEIESSKRATILSINNLLGGVGMAIGGLLIGYFADLWTINTAYKISAILMSFSIILLLFIKKNKD